MVYKPTYNWGPHPVETWLCFKMGVNITKDAGDLSLLGEASGVIKRVAPSGPPVSSIVAAGKFPERGPEGKSLVIGVPICSDTISVG
jgi:hypothetical protein